ncbi:MAG: PQQ-dependent sugar dehydrogenase, partial [Phycisphaerales bacterium]|nr:PQQ-dependent sugar dehydrogenase [Phycisphaerales bacterium]
TMPNMPLSPAPLLKGEVIATGLRAPWALEFLPDGRVMFTEREGRVRVIQDGKLLDEPAVIVPDIKSWSKMGLLGLVLDPQFAENHFVYVAECYGKSNDEHDNSERVVRYREQNNKLIEPKTLIDHIPCFHNHAGGRMAFGPDGKLYITTGDADQPLLAQRLDALNGKILRINSDGTIPSDNPFFGKPNANPAIWSYGQRNSQGLAFQPGTGLLFETEHGPNGGDEFNLIEKGQNYGWPFVTHDRTASGVSAPLIQFTPSIGPSSAVFYEGDMFPNLRGDLLVATLRGESILRVHLDGTKVTSVERLLFRKYGRIRELKIAPDGALWISTSEFDPPEGRKYEKFDQIIRLTPAGGEVTKIDRPPTARDIPRPVGAVNIYRETCLSCHGDGTDNSLNSNLFDGKWQLSKGTDGDLRQVIRDGNISRGMPGFAGSMTAKEIDDVIGYIRQRETAAKPKAPGV